MQTPRQQHPRKHHLRLAVVGGAVAVAIFLFTATNLFSSSDRQVKCKSDTSAEEAQLDAASVVETLRQRGRRSASGSLIEDVSATAEGPTGSHDLEYEGLQQPPGTIGERSFIARIDEDHRFLASPSILQLPSGRLLVLFEKQPSWGHRDFRTAFKFVFASDNGGLSWEHIASPGPIQWPQIFMTESGVYIIGCQRVFSQNNNLLIMRMEDGTEGAAWSPPVQLTDGWSVITINTGVDVSHGRVTKAFEIIPSMALPVKSSLLTAPVHINISMGADQQSWQHPPIVDLSVQEAAGFVAHTLVKIPYGEEDRALFFRVLAVDEARNVLKLRLERYTLFWQLESVDLLPGQELTVGSNANIYGGVDWVSVSMSANASANLTDPAEWTFSNPVGNPASLYPNEVRKLFDVAFRADYHVSKSIIGFDHGYVTSKELAYEAGFGSLYWMEGCVFRLQDRRGGNGKVINLLRINNDLLCNLAAVIVLDDREPGRLHAKFLRYTTAPGLSVGHPAIVYDNVTDLYWMASNVNRDSLRRWKQPQEPDANNPPLHVTPFSKCEVDRSTIGLYYSGNGFDWHPAGIVDYHMSFGRHFTYPHMTISGDDLLIVMRATADGKTRESTRDYYSNHNSMQISFHRVRGFRSQAMVEWVTHLGEYSAQPRLLSSNLED